MKNAEKVHFGDARCSTEKKTQGSWHVEALTSSVSYRIKVIQKYYNYPISQLG